jgi:hypothetical protein
MLQVSKDNSADLFTLVMSFTKDRVASGEARWIYRGITSFVFWSSFISFRYPIHTFFSLCRFSVETKNWVASLSFRWHSLQHRAAACVNMWTLLRRENDATYTCSQITHIRSHKPASERRISFVIRKVLKLGYFAPLRLSQGSGYSKAYSHSGHVLFESQMSTSYLSLSRQIPGWCPRAVVFKLICSSTPRYNFPSTLYPQSCWCIIQVTSIHIL